jgi:hypothetical protein
VGDLKSKGSFILIVFCFLIGAGQKDGFAQSKDSNQINYRVSETKSFSFKSGIENAKDTLVKVDSTGTSKRPEEISGVVGHIIIPLIIFTGAVVGVVILVVMAVK